MCSVVFIKPGILSFLFILLTASSSAQNTNSDTILPSVIITPFELTGNETINFPLVQGTPAGDINGDGMTDMIFNSYSGDEQTPDMTDMVSKSVISLSAGLAGENVVLHNSYTYGIGDYNNDGYDDIVDIVQKSIRFGCSSGISDDAIQIDIPDSHREFFFAGDINDDGFSEFFLGEISFCDSLLVFSGPDSNSFFFPAPNVFWHFDTDETIFNIYDYDSDDTSELCISMRDFSNHTRMIKFYNFNKSNNQLTLEHSLGYYYLHEPSPHFPADFTDLNGDGNIDIAHVYGAYDSTNTYRFNLEVYFGLDSDPYFNSPLEVEVGNPTRFLYHAGDFNGDGSDDWYSKYDDTTVVVYYGSPDILTSGIQKVYYENGNSHYYLPQCRYYYSSINSIRDIHVLDYDNDSFKDLYFNYCKVDGNKRFEIIGTGIVLGNETPDFLNPVIIGKSAEESFQELSYGYYSSNVGDMNKDGFDDWGILALSGCYLDIYFGGSELDYTPDIKFLLPQTNKSKCFNWSSGDMNGDGWIDIAISNSSEYTVGPNNNFISPRNEVYIFFGSQVSQNEYFYGDADFILKDEDTFEEFGKYISIVGDYNADEYDDLVVGGSLYNERIAFVYFGGETISEVPDMIISRYCNQSFPYFANPITPCGDVNADGYDDFTLGDPVNDGGQSLIYFGGPNADNQYDKVIVNSISSGSSFGSLTAKQEGDFDGDGYPDLFHYSKNTEEILVYLGGPFFDTIHDYTIYDSTFTNSWDKIGYIDRNAETGRSSIARTWTIYPSYLESDIYDLRIYSIEDVALNRPGIVLKNRLERSGYSFVSGDFDNDGLCEILTGIPYERNYGNRYGGVVYKYIPSAPASIEDKPQLKQNSACIFPNPATDAITISYESCRDEELTIKAVNLIGQIVFLKQYPSVNVGANKFKVNTTNWLPGIYLIELQQGTEKSTLKLVKSD